MSGEHDVCPFCRDDMCNEACKDRRIAELEAKARTDAEGIAEQQQIIDSYNAFCGGVGAHVILAEQDAEIKRLRAIVDKLPKTADGVPVVPGDDLWSHYYNEVIGVKMPWLAVGPNEDGRGQTGYDPARCFSTREAAIAASKEGKR